MIDFGPVKRREMSLTEFGRRLGINQADLITYTHAILDEILDLIGDASDADVSFIPEDPDAEDPYAENLDEVHIGWSLGHIIAHTTASSEETCAHAANLARGVEPCGRNRYEVPWQELRTVSDLERRLAESRRIRLAYLQAWPDQPHFQVTYTPYRSPQNCITRVLAGLFHEESHLEQMREALDQAKAVRGEGPSR